MMGNDDEKRLLIFKESFQKFLDLDPACENTFLELAKVKDNCGLWALCTLGEYYARIGADVKALKVFSLFKKSGGLEMPFASFCDVCIYWWVGVLLFHRKKFQYALRFFEESVQRNIEPKNIAITWQGFANHAICNYDKAASCYVECLSLICEWAVNEEEIKVLLNAAQNQIPIEKIKGLRFSLDIYYFDSK